MKLLVLALCVCAAAAAPQRQPWQQAKAVAQAVVQPFAKAAAAVAQPAQTYAKASAGSSNDVDAPVLRSESEVTAEGFNYIYETGNGISAQSTGALKKVDNTEALAFQGSYAYTAPDGTPVRFTYIADENGYQPQSDLLPVAPPVPVAIARALEYIAAHPPAPEVSIGKKY